jgi:biopolymer transport protein ExbB
MHLGLFKHIKPLEAIAFALVVVVFVMAVASPSTSFAYDEDADPAPADADDEAAPAAAGDADADGDADGAADADTAEEATDPDQSFLSWMLAASGAFGLLILLLSFIMVALVMMNILQVRRDNFVPPAFIEQFEQRLNSKDYQGAYEDARQDDSLVARVLAAGLSKLNQGYDKAVEGMQEVGDDENMAYDHRLSYLALISAIAPMLGLMGTVYGMILSFRVIATSSTTPKPSELADGISTALFTTLEGLVVAIPAMVFYAFLRNRVARFLLETSMVSEGLMSRFAQAGQQKRGGPAPAGAPAAPKE